MIVFGNQSQMLEEPALNYANIARCLHEEYALSVDEVAFLPLGADLNTAVYRVLAGNGSAYFVQLRSGVFDDDSVAIPKCLGDAGFKEMIPPIAAGWKGTGHFTCPFVRPFPPKASCASFSLLGS